MFNIDATLDDLSLQSAEAALLLGVTRRAVDMWRTGERAVPGPVIAYFNLLASLPDELQAVELHRLRKMKRNRKCHNL